MLALRELQREVGAALLGGGEVTTAAVRADGLAPAARLAIYRHHVFTSLVAALETTYPVVARLVDVRFFRYAADQYVRAEPPAGPCLFEYGGSLPEFLEQFPPSRGLAYLADVGRLEWAMNLALHAPDAPAPAPAALPTLPAVALQPSVTLLASPWPIDAIWRANQPDGDGAADLAAGGVRLQIWRLDDDVVLRALPPAAFAFRRALARTGRLEAAAEAALAVEADLDLAVLLRELLDERVLAE